eukprot:2074445-Ditylum_brightwellii.AAC.1
MACNGILTQHGRKSDGKTLQKNKTITPTANVVTTTTLEDTVSKRSSNTPIIIQEKHSDNTANSSDVSHVGNSNKNQ